MKKKLQKSLNNLLLVITLLVTGHAAFAQAPTITSFSPGVGTIGTLVTITGTNLNNIDTIKIGGVLAIKVSATNTNLVSMVMPGTTTGSIYLKNSNGNVTSGTNFIVTNHLTPYLQQGSKLVGSGSVGAAYQGTSASISADGNTIIVGGKNDSNNTGAAWVYTRNGGVWSQQGNKLVGTGAIGSSFQGISVSLSADGNTAIVGGFADSNARGAAWIFTRSAGVWSQQGNKMVGTGFVGPARQGQSVCLSADGNTAIVGGWRDNDSIGAVWVYTRNAGVWTQQGNKLVGSGIIRQAYQGASVKVSSDGNTIVFSGYMDNEGKGAAWVFTRIAGVWSQQGNKLVGTGSVGTNVFQGNSIGISADGNTVMLGGPLDSNGAGAAWVFTHSSGIWNQQGSKLVGTGNVGLAGLGQSVSLSADGNIAMVGGVPDNNGVGATCVFNRTGSTWSQQGNKIVGSGSVGTAYQGASVCLSADGNTTVIGAPFENSGIGAAWVFTSPIGTSINETNAIAFAPIYCKPNPFTHILEISFESNTKETTKLIIMDAVGKEVLAKNIQSIIGDNTITIDELAYLKSGIYFARLANNNGLSQAFKLVKE